MSGSITANISFSFQGSVKKMCFLIIVCLFDLGLTSLSTFFSHIATGVF